MTLRSQINNGYIDGNSLVTPNLAPIPAAKGSDNGCTFTSEYYIYLKKNNELTQTDPVEYLARIMPCQLAPGLFSRSPGDRGLQPPDDYLAIMAACSQLGVTEIPSSMIEYGLQNWGCFNNTNPGLTSKASFLWRQPQLIAASFAAARRSQWNPVIWFLNFYTALCILVGDVNDSTDSVDGRRLTFLLIQAMLPVSLVCRLAAALWAYRQNKIYGENFMFEIAIRYYTDYHPFWIYARYE